MGYNQNRGEIMVSIVDPKDMGPEFMAQFDVSKKEPDNLVYFDKRVRPDDFDADGLIIDLYEDFLRAAQQEYIGLGSTFEGWLKRCVETLKWRKDELSKEFHFSLIDERTYRAANDLADRSIEAVTKYLELPDAQRLIGV